MSEGPAVSPFLPTIGEAERQLLDDVGLEFGVDFDTLQCDVSPNDVMFDGRMVNYLQGGITAARCMRRGLAGRTPSSILDFGCGHGRVLRILKVVYPEAHLTGADLDEDAVRFCRDRLGVRAFLSAADPTEIRDGDGPYDLIWVGSVFTHIDAPRWAPMLQFLDSVLSPGGTLVFTIQGPDAAERLRAGVVHWGLEPALIEELLDGFKDFSYVNYEGQNDYGISLATIEWVKRLVESETSLVITDYDVGGWDKHQDAVTCVKQGTHNRNEEAR